MPVDVTERDRSVLDSYDRTRSIRATARDLNVSRHIVQRILKESHPLEQPPASQHSPIPPEYSSLDELLDERAKTFERLRLHDEATKLRVVNVNIDGPYGVTHLGDPHVGADGCDISSLRKHIEVITSNQALFASNLGDVTDNWTDGLIKLYANTSVKKSDEWRLAEWLLLSLQRKWIAIIGGNHDWWLGCDNPINYMLSQSERQVQAPHRMRLKLVSPNGREVRIHARHSFKGSSMWSAVQGHARSFKFEHRDHVLICGHWHRSQYTVVKDPASSLVSHHIQVGSFKRFDDYGVEHGLLNETISPSFTTIINPYASSESALIQGFFDVEEASDYLNFLRSKHKSK